MALLPAGTKYPATSPTSGGWKVSDESDIHNARVLMLLRTTPHQSDTFVSNHYTCKTSQLRIRHNSLRENGSSNNVQSEHVVLSGVLESTKARLHCIMGVLSCCPLVIASPQWLVVLVWKHFANLRRACHCRRNGLLGFQRILKKSCQVQSHSQPLKFEGFLVDTTRKSQTFEVH